MSDLASDKVEVVRKRLKKMGKRLNLSTPPGWGFALLMFEFGDDGNAQYVSNTRRPDMIKLLREMADRLEHGFAGEPGVDDPGSHV